MSADGAVFHPSTGHPVIAMSLRFPRLGYFWFTLLHELAHLVLHADQLKEPVFFDVEGEEKDRAERAAIGSRRIPLSNCESSRNCAPNTTLVPGRLHAYAAEVRPPELDRWCPQEGIRQLQALQLTSSTSTTSARSSSSHDSLRSIPQSEAR